MKRTNPTPWIKRLNITVRSFLIGHTIYDVVGFSQPGFIASFLRPAWEYELKKISSSRSDRSSLLFIDVSQFALVWSFLLQVLYDQKRALSQI